MDKVTLERIELIHPKLRNELREIYSVICERVEGCRFTHTLRTIAEQDALYAQGRTKPGAIVTKSHGGYSYHNYGMAVDIAFIRGGKLSYDIKADIDGDGKADWIEVVQVFQEFRWEWGGNWKFTDLPHFQKTFGYSVRELFRMPKSPAGYPLI